MTLSLARLTRSQEWLDAVADRVQPLVRDTLKRSLPVRNALDGTWLGTPLHPALTDVPIGAWTAAVALDAIDGGSESPAVRRSADGALAVGVLAALPTALTGLSDWSHLRGNSRRAGALHGLLNVAGVVLNVTSLGLRRSERRDLARALSALAYVVTATSAHLGGELSYGFGIRVNRTAWERGRRSFTPVLDESELTGTEFRRVTSNGTPVLVTRSEEGEICAIAATCTHLGGPLDKGAREGNTVVCPWHGSRFDLCTGEVVAAPAVFPQPRYEARAWEGKVEVRLADEGI